MLVPLSYIISNCSFLIGLDFSKSKSYHILLFFKYVLFIFVILQLHINFRISMSVTITNNQIIKKVCWNVDRDCFEIIDQFIKNKFKMCSPYQKIVYLSI